MGRRYCGCKGRCMCNKPKEIVYPVREDVQHKYSEETVRHVHPSHTRVINHHTIRNEHVYPHSTSYENEVNEVDVRGVRDRECGVRGAFSPYGRGYGGKGCGCRGRCGCRRRGFGF